MSKGAAWCGWGQVSGRGQTGRPYVADDVAKELRAREAEDGLRPLDRLACVEVELAACDRPPQLAGTKPIARSGVQRHTVEFAGDTGSVVADFASLHRKTEMRALGAQRVDGILVVHNQDIFITNLDQLALTSGQFAFISNLEWP
jgi:hypothetical protein